MIKMPVAILIFLLIIILILIICSIIINSLEVVVMKKEGGNIKKGGGTTFADFKKFLAEDIAKSRDSTTNKYTYKSIIEYTDEIEKWFEQKAIEERGWSGFAYSFIATANTKNKYFDKIVRLLGQFLFDKMLFISQNGETRPPTEIVESMSAILENYFNWLNKKDDDPEFQYKLGELNPSSPLLNETKFDQFKKDLLFIINSGIKKLTPISSIKCKSEIINGIIAWFTREKDALERIDAYIITVFVDKLMQLVQYSDFTTTNNLEIYSLIQSLIIDPIEVDIKAYFDWLIQKKNKLSASYIQFILDDNTISPEERENKITEILVHSNSEDYKNNLLKHWIEQFHSNNLSNAPSTDFIKFKEKIIEIIDNILKNNPDISQQNEHAQSVYNELKHWWINTISKQQLNIIQNIIMKLLVGACIVYNMHKKLLENPNKYLYLINDLIAPIEGKLQKYFDWLIKKDNDPELLYIQEILDDNAKYPSEELKFAEIVEIIELEKVNEIRNALFAKQGVREHNIRRMFTAVDNLDLEYRGYGSVYKDSKLVREQEEAAADAADAAAFAAADAADAAAFAAAVDVMMR